MPVFDNNGAPDNHHEVGRFTIQFPHRENDSAYSLLAPRGSYRHISPVQSVDIHGVVRRPERSDLSKRDKKFTTLVRFPMNNLFPPIITLWPNGVIFTPLPTNWGE